VALFGKERPEPPLAVSSRAPGAEAKAAAAPSSTVLGKGCRFEGRLTGSDDVVILGHFKGEIDLKSDLRVGEGGSVEADVKSRNIWVSGRVVGKVTAQQKVELDPRGTLLGSIQSPKLVVAEGAQFKGDVDMSGAESAKRAEAGRPSEAPSAAPPSAELRDRADLKPAKA
jgi:cytoskeletal protein CcmA (bactofilin family)